MAQVRSTSVLALSGTFSAFQFKDGELTEEGELLNETPYGIKQSNQSPFSVPQHDSAQRLCAEVHSWL